MILEGFPEKMAQAIADIELPPKYAIGQTFYKKSTATRYVILGVKIQLGLRDFMYELASDYGRSFFFTADELEGYIAR